ncbi:SMC-Scp complex subunit ScpB [Pseudonocardia sp. C8]|nr:SMC-Scp complex subunit ScpB [Pseudonocardia sp. C8]MBC3191640.1 SMC-Scp complex subunit ScpB [Pseudonocardia sp. C8]
MRLIGRTVPRSPHAGTWPSGSGAAPTDGTREEPAATRPIATEPAATEPSATQAADDPVEAAAGRGAAEPAGAGSDTVDAAAGPAEAGSDTVDTAAGPAEREEPEPEPDPEPEETGDTAEPTDDTDDLADDSELENALEALLLVVDAPVDEASLASTLNQTPSRIRHTLNRMSLAYTADRRGIDLRRAGEGWRFYTRDRYAPYVEKLLLDGQRARLTRAALETLAVVAYRQPVTRARVSAVRGVNCDGVLRTLLTRGLVEEAGTEEQTGGTLFRTTELFLERLGLSSVQELPPLAPLLPDIDAIDDLDGWT